MNEFEVVSVFRSSRKYNAAYASVNSSRAHPPPPPPPRANPLTGRYSNYQLIIN